MKLIIQIPCFNESATLPQTVADLPTEVAGFDRVEVLVIDDGSRDDTAQVARSLGVDHIVRLPTNRGLATAFMTGLLAAIERGADVVVNTDADNQYRGAGIARLVAPILAGEADIVVGARPIGSIPHFSTPKKALQRLGSAVVRSLSGTLIEDAPSGFRAFSRESAMRLNVFSRYTYTLETLIQAGNSNLRVRSVPIEVNAPTRKSRLIRSVPSYVARSAADLLRTYVIYRPTRLFFGVALLMLAPALVLSYRYVGFFIAGDGKGHVQSVVVAGTLAISSCLVATLGVLAHLLAINRRLLEELRYLARRSLTAEPASPSARGASTASSNDQPS